MNNGYQIIKVNDIITIDSERTWVRKNIGKIDYTGKPIIFEITINNDYSGAGVMHTTFPVFTAIQTGEYPSINGGVYFRNRFESYRIAFYSNIETGDETILEIRYDEEPA